MRRLLRVLALVIALSFALLPSHPVSADSDLAAPDFQATSLKDHVLLTWSNGVAPNRLGFNLYRGTNFEASGLPLNDDPIPLVDSNATQAVSYQWQDFDVEEGATYYYWLETLHASGDTDLRGPIGVLHQSPTAIVLADLKGAPSPSVSLPWIALSLAAVSGGAVALRRRRL